MLSHRLLKSARVLFALMLVLLSTLYILGMVTNIYVSPPYTAANLSSHYFLGLISSFFSVDVLVVSLLLRRLPVVLSAITLTVSMAVAGFSGLAFAFGAQMPMYTLVMSIAFLVAFASCFFGLHCVRPARSLMPPGTVAKGESPPAAAPMTSGPGWARLVAGLIVVWFGAFAAEAGLHPGTLDIRSPSITLITFLVVLGLVMMIGGAYLMSTRRMSP